MKKTNCGLMAVIALGGLLALASASPAQEKKIETKPATPAAPAAPTAPGAPATSITRPDRTEQMARFLGLSDDQKTKVKPILEEETKQLLGLRNPQGVQPEERRTKIKEIRTATNDKMKPILTAEQWEKWDKMRGITPRQPPGTAPAAPTAPAPPPAPAK